MKFEANVNGFKILMDATKENGGNDEGPRPKQLLLAALGGCTGMDVISLLKKMRVPISSLEINVEGDLSDEHPKKYNEMKVLYILTGNQLENHLDNITKSIELSQSKYCGVSAQFKASIPLNYEIILK